MITAITLYFYQTFLKSFVADRIFVSFDILMILLRLSAIEIVENAMALFNLK